MQWQWSGGSAVGASCWLEVAVLDLMKAKSWTPWKHQVALFGCDTTRKRDKGEVLEARKSEEGGVVSRLCKRARLGMGDTQRLSYLDLTAIVHLQWPSSSWSVGWW